MKRINLHLTDKQIAALKLRAKETGMTAAEHVRRAVDAYLAKGKK